MKKIFFSAILAGLFWSQDANAQRCKDDDIDNTIEIGAAFGNAIWNMIPLSDEQEEQIGDEFHQQMLQTYRIIDNDPRRKKLEKMFNKMVAHVDNKNIKYDVHLIDDSELINAFSIAGGHLYVTTAIMNWVKSDDELAFIIGHEIGHVELKHCVQSIKKSVGIKALMDYLNAGELSEQVAALQSVLGTPFGQADELDSDKKGAYLAYMAGYNPRKGEDFFRRLKEQENYNQNDKLMRTHPFSAQREACLEEYIVANGYTR